MSSKRVCLVLLILAAFAVPPAAATSAGDTLTVRVYSDGSVLVSQSVTAPNGAASVDVPLLSTVLSNIVATDGNGAPLSFRISGENITVYSLGAQKVILTYDTQNLTGKEGAVWNVRFETRYNTTVILPAGSTVTNVSGVPYSLEVQGGSPVVTIPPGSWALYYGVSLSTLTTSQTTTAEGGDVFRVSIAGLGWAALGAGAAVIVVVGALLVWRRRRFGPNIDRGALRPDDVQVLDFIREKGGKVMEPEIRTRFALPKTSAWRQIKRLERMGYVKVTKAGSQNMIELSREPPEGS